MERSNRLTYFDFLRGLAILLVVGIHTYTARPFAGWDNIVQIGIRETINFAVPLFLSISGYFIGKKIISNSSQYFSFLKRQLPRVYIPAVLWSIPIVLFWIFLGHSTMDSISKGLLCKAFGPYYFIALIMQMYILHPIVKSMALKPEIGGV